MPIMVVLRMPLLPSNTEGDARRPVHQNVRILNNFFVTLGNPLLYAKSTSQLVFKGNEVKVEVPSSWVGNKWTILEGCSKVTIKDNKFLKP